MLGNDGRTCRIRCHFPAFAWPGRSLLPYGVTRWMIERFNRIEGRSAVFYFHPWEIDPAQPRIPGIDAKTRFRHYVNIDRTESRIEQLLGDFAWARMDELFLAPAGAERQAA